MTSPIVTATAVLFPLIRQAAQGDQTVLWLALGALLGICYVLGTEKYVRAMSHRHVYVRLSMLFLSGFCWLGAAGAVCIVCVKIYAQTADPLEGFERVVGILLPAVVRADLIVDWAKRVSFTLLNVRFWVCACVQFQRIMVRTAALRAQPELNISRDVYALANAAYTDRGDVISSERLIWESDVSLVRADEIMKHFMHLGRISIYGVSVFLGAVPAGVLWIIYALFLAFRAGRRKNAIAATLYFFSIPFTPFGVVFALIASFGLVVGVVSLSIFGTLVQFFVYWAIRFVYCIVRIGLSEEWADFPIVSRNRYNTTDFSVDDYSEDGKRHPNEAGAAIARGGVYFPSELEFALSPWDGSVSYEDDLTCDKVDIPSIDDEVTDDDIPNRPEKVGTQQQPSSFYIPQLPFNNKVTDSSNSSSTVDQDAGYPTASLERDLSLLARIGQDRTNNTPRKRRMSTYYTMGFFVNMQVESGGKGFCLETIPELSESEFQERVNAFNSFVVEDAAVACSELAKRLKRMTRYRIIHCGAENEDLVGVEQWIRAVLLFLFDSPLDTPGQVGLLVRQENRFLDRPLYEAASSSQTHPNLDDETSP